MSEVLFDGYVEDSDGLSRIELIRDGDFVDVWQNDDIRDDLDGTLADFTANFGWNLYPSRDSYKGLVDDVLNVRDIWPKELV